MVCRSDFASKMNFRDFFKGKAIFDFLWISHNDICRSQSLMTPSIAQPFLYYEILLVRYQCGWVYFTTTKLTFRCIFAHRPIEAQKPNLSICLIRQARRPLLQALRPFWLTPLFTIINKWPKSTEMDFHSLFWTLITYEQEQQFPLVKVFRSSLKENWLWSVIDSEHLEFF